MDHLHLIDVSGFIYRAHFGTPLLNRSDGLPVGAVFTFASMLDRLLLRHRGENHGVVAVFDAGRRNWRHNLYPGYKANRKAAPTDLVPQFPIFRVCAEAYGVPGVEADGYEADDIIATYARLAVEDGIRVTIHSSDKDLMQLVRAGEVSMFDPIKRVAIDVAMVMEKWGVPPSRVLDVQALAGDSTDAIPGVDGIGPKIAAELVNAYGGLEAVLAKADEVRQPARRDALKRCRDMARLSYVLAGLNANVPGLPALDDLSSRPPDDERLIAFLREYEFVSLLPEGVAA